MQELQFTLTIEETNQVLDALGDQPFDSVFTLINKIQNQAAEQLQQQNAAKTTDAANPIGLKVKSDDPEK